MSQNATIQKNLFPITGHSVDSEIKRQFLQVDCQQKDVDKLRKLVLEYNHETYAFSGWNSDTNKAYFVNFMALLCQPNFAKIVQS
jgi:hypothetical protein